jgi:hypothetical protein
MTEQENAVRTPRIQMNHADGPLLIQSNGELHWLTFWERVALFFGKTDAEALDKKHAPTCGITHLTMY